LNSSQVLGGDSLLSSSDFVDACEKAETSHATANPRRELENFH